MCRNDVSFEKRGFEEMKYSKNDIIIREYLSGNKYIYRVVYCGKYDYKIKLLCKILKKENTSLSINLGEFEIHAVNALDNGKYIKTKKIEREKAFLEML